MLEAVSRSTSSLSRNDTVSVGGVNVMNVPGGNQRSTQRPDLVPGVDPYLKDGNRWLNPAAFTTPQPGTFGNLPRNAVRGPKFAQLDLMFSKDFQLPRSQSFQIPRGDVQPGQSTELREPCGDAAGHRRCRCSIHRRSGCALRLHAWSAQSNCGPRDRTSDADFPSLLVLGT